MSETIDNLKLLIKRYTDHLKSNNKNFILTTNELEAIRKALRYLELIDDLSKSYRGENNDSNG